MRTNSDTPNLRPFYLLLVGVGCIVAHLASEFAAMGTGAESVLFSAKHLYLGVLALAGIATLVICGRALLLRASGARDLKRLLHIGLATLPFGGKGAAYFALTATLQLGLGLLTQFGEGCPFCGHDIAAGVLGALLTVVLFGFAARAVGRRLPNVVAALVNILPAADDLTPRFVDRVERASIASRSIVWFADLYNRPPPFQSILASS
ncbi:MAG TPA: hypothetical protein VID19_04265 [Candidatus Eremiobacteraceae bacterium]|jgi:hypothetical protein